MQKRICFKNQINEIVREYFVQDLKIFKNIVCKKKLTLLIYFIEIPIEDAVMHVTLFALMVRASPIKLSYLYKKCLVQ